MGYWDKEQGQWTYHSKLRAHCDWSTGKSVWAYPGNTIFILIYGYDIKQYFKGYEGGVEEEVAVVLPPFPETAVTMWRGGQLVEEPRGVCHVKVAALIGKATRWRWDFG